jgi:hypothetical protein
VATLVVGKSERIAKKKAVLDRTTRHGFVDNKKILRPSAARHGAAARLAQIERATALAFVIWANAK